MINSAKVRALPPIVLGSALTFGLGVAGSSAKAPR